MKLPLPPPRPPNRVYPPGTPGLHGLVSVVTGVTVVCALYFAREVLIPITLSVLLSFLLAPLVTALRRLHFGQGPSIFIAVISSVAALLAIGTLIGAQIVQLASDLPQYQVAIERKIQTVQEKTVGQADVMLGKAAAALQRASPQPPVAPRPTGRAAKNAPAVPIPVEVHEPSPTPIQLAQRAISPAIGPLETTFIVLVVTIFILMQREDLRDRLISLFGSRDLHRTTTAINDAAVRLSRYFVAQLAVNLSAGSAIAIGLAIIGVPGALLFGVCAALLRFVPYIGIWIAAVMAAILAAAIQPQWTMAVSTVILFFVVDVVAGQIAEPLLYGHHSGLSPLAVVVAAIFWSWLWGPIGLVLSTPLTLCIVTLGRYADRLNFLTVLLGDQPALTPGQNFYQRLLADDPHEAIVHAERLLKEMSLIDYYDNVALEGLRLARNDALRGVLSAEQLGRINEALADIVENLETVEGLPDNQAQSDDAEEAASSRIEALHREPAAPPDPKTQTPRVEPTLSVPQGDFRRGAPQEDFLRGVLCVPGRGAFDEAGTAIAVQLLGRRGLTAVASTYASFRNGRAGEPADLARASVASMASVASVTSGASIICVVSLDAPESPPYLRNLLRRIRERHAKAILIVGIGAQTESTPDQNTADNPRSAATFRDLIDECRAASVAPPFPEASQMAG